MSASRKFFISCFLLLAGSASSVAGAATGGIIHFEGMIVESPCDVNVNARNVIMACHREGKMKKRTIDLNKRIREQQGVKNVAKMKMNYIKPERTVVIVEIVYK